MAATSKGTIANKRRLRSFDLAMRRLKARGMLCWAKGPVAHAAHAEVNAAPRHISDAWVDYRAVRPRGYAIEDDCRCIPTAHVHGGIPDVRPAKQAGGGPGA